MKPVLRRVGKLEARHGGGRPTLADYRKAQMWLDLFAKFEQEEPRRAEDLSPEELRHYARLTLAEVCLQAAKLREREAQS